MDTDDLIARMERTIVSLSVQKDDLAGKLLDSLDRERRLRDALARISETPHANGICPRCVATDALGVTAETKDAAKPE